MYAVCHKIMASVSKQIQNYVLNSWYVLKVKPEQKTVKARPEEYGERKDFLLEIQINGFR